MRISLPLLGFAVLALGACAELRPEPEAPPSEFIVELPAGLLEIAAPYQDLTAVKLDHVDGCYVYRHVGVVETTFLPLRSIRGNPICTGQAVVPATG